MKNKMAWLVLAIPIVTLMGITPAEANGWDIWDYICRIHPSWCQPPGGGGGGPTSVPEPSTLALLATGAGVWGLRLLRRRK